MTKPARTIAVANQKGGVAKTIRLHTTERSIYAVYLPTRYLPAKVKRSSTICSRVSDLSRIGTASADRFPTYSRATEKSCDERVVGDVESGLPLVDPTTMWRAICLLINYSFIHPRFRKW